METFLLYKIWCLPFADEMMSGWKAKGKEGCVKGTAWQAGLWPAKMGHATGAAQRNGIANRH